MKKNYLLILALFSVYSLSSQEYFTSLPENPDPGKCFAKCILPDEFKDEIVKIETEPEHKILKVIPASFEIGYKDFVLVPASKKNIYEPAEYTTTIDTLWVKDPYNELSVIPASFSSDTEEIEVKPAIGNWVAGDKDPECPSINPADCRVFHYVENPAVIRTIPKKIN